MLGSAYAWSQGHEWLYECGQGHFLHIHPLVHSLWKYLLSWGRGGPGAECLAGTHKSLGSTASGE